MIPKRIHYCWLSNEPYSRKINECMDSWHRVLKGYEFVLWDMSKVQRIRSAWVEEAVSRKKWAFAADFVRLWALYSEGGIYLDSDVEMLKEFGNLLNGPLMLGAEGGTGNVEAAVMGAEPGNHLIKKALDSFGDVFTEETLPQRLSRVIGADISLLDSAVFSPKDWRTGKMHITSQTYAIHHFAGSWLSRKEQWAHRSGRLFGTWAVPCTRWIFNKLGL